MTSATTIEKVDITIHKQSLHCVQVNSDDLIRIKNHLKSLPKRPKVISIVYSSLFAFAGSMILVLLVEDSFLGTTGTFSWLFVIFLLILATFLVFVENHFFLSQENSLIWVNNDLDQWLKLCPQPLEKPTPPK